MGVVVGGGSGHEPAFAGYVGHGMADAACCGNVFASPPSDVVLAGIHEADRGRGVILAYGNYAGDVMNFGLARELAAAGGIDVREIRVTDDVASAPAAEAEKRRGSRGTSSSSSASEPRPSGATTSRRSFASPTRRTQATRSMGVALSSCEVPGSGGPTFDLPADAIEIGMGVHGEPGIRRGPLEPADAIARTLVEAIMAETDTSSALEVALLVNGLGATATMEQYILYRAARQTLEGLGASVSRSYVGEFVTSLEMAGASITVMVLDDELRALLDAPARTVALSR